MTRTVELNIPIDPVAASRPRIPRWGKPYYLKKYDQFRHDLYDYLKITVDPKQGVFTKIVTVENLTFYYPMPKSWSKKKKNEMDGLPHTSKPDLSNLEKAVEDGLTGFIFEDDRFVWKVMEKSKVWSDTGSIYIRLSGE